MATASFERNAPTMLDMGLGADDLDALIKQAGDAVLAGAPQSAPTNGTPAGDAATEWEGMPEYASEDKTAHRSIIVHFANDEDVLAFAQLIRADIAEKTKFTWYPPVARRDLASLSYVADDSA
jgi:hypothetical protein